MPICHAPCDDRRVGSRGVGQHRAAHLRRGETVVMTLRSGTYEWTPPSEDSRPGAS